MAAVWALNIGYALGYLYLVGVYVSSAVGAFYLRRRHSPGDFEMLDDGFGFAVEVPDAGDYDDSDYEEDAAYREPAGGGLHGGCQPKDYCEEETDYSDYSADYSG